jgi:hypothetical protein
MNLRRMSARRLLVALAAGVVMIGAITAGAWGLAGLRVRWDGPAAQETPGTNAGLWTGHVDQHLIRSSTSVGVGYHAAGELWLRIDEAGRARGHATVRYQPVFDASGINQRLDAGKDLGTMYLGVFGPSGVLAGQQLVQLLGVSAEFNEPMSVREYDLTGELNGPLVLHASGQPSPLHTVVSLDYLDHRETLTEQDLAIRQPFTKAAHVVERDGHSVASSIDPDGVAQPRTDGDVTERSSTYWSVERVS